MSQDDFSDAALVLFGHGSSLNAESGAPVYQHATELRRRKVFGEIREAFWKQEPRLTEVLREVKHPLVFLVPFFISEGYFSDEVIPRELGFAASNSGAFPRLQHQGGQRLVYCQPVGAHPAMTEVLLARARGVVAQFPFPRAPKPKELTLFVAGHGTEQSETSRKAIEQQVERIRALDIYADVHGVFLEEEPLIADWYQWTATRNAVMVPFFVSDGMHVREDIPILLGEPERVVRQRLQNGQPTWRNPSEKRGKLVWYAQAVGTEPQMAEMILEQAREAARRME